MRSVGCWGDHVPREFRGLSWCRVCHCNNGSQTLGDGTWQWPWGYAHYLEKHGVKLPEEFLEHVRKQIGTAGR